MSDRRLVVVDGVRTPFSKFGTDLSEFGAEELGRVAVSALLVKTGIDPALIDEVIFGCVAQPSDSANVARVIGLRAGIPQSVPAVTVHRNCASGCEALTTAAERMMAGKGEIFVVGGAESMSQVSLLFKQNTARKFSMLARAKSFPEKLAALSAFRFSDFQPRVGLQLGLTDPVCGLNMGQTAEVLAREYGITREMQDAFALKSHARAVENREKLSEEITPVYISKPSPRAVTEDNGPREKQSMSALASLKPVFEKNVGSVTAGNSSQITDGAVALLVMTEEKAAQLGYTPLGRLVGYEYAGCDPKRMGLGPVFAISKLVRSSGIGLEQAELVEINEAFAAQVLAVLKCLDSDEFAKTHLGRETRVGRIEKDILNVNGGAIALGHPVGASGARLVLTALKELGRQNKQRALVSVCVGGGQGAALWLERI